MILELMSPLHRFNEDFINPQMTPSPVSISRK